MCDLCAMTYRSSQIRKRWDGALVCHGPGTRKCWEPRHPVDFIRSRQDLHGVRNTRERNTAFIEDVYPNGVTADDL